MALSYREAMTKAKAMAAGKNDIVFVDAAISTLQSGGLSMWAQGTLLYQAGGAGRLVFGAPSLRSDNYNWRCYFSDRRKRPPAEPGFFEGTPFDDAQTEKLRLTVSMPLLRGLQTHISQLTATLRFEGGSSFSFPLSESGDLLTGVGAALGSQTGIQADHAIYTLAFQEPGVLGPVN